MEQGVGLGELSLGLCTRHDDGSGYKLQVGGLVMDCVLFVTLARVGYQLILYSSLIATRGRLIPTTSGGSLVMNKV